MSFRGELRQFELPDILQLIASQQKAGWLKVMWKGNCQFVFFRDGKITSTKNPADDTDPLETFIIRKGYLNEDQADRVAAIRRKSGMDVQDVLQKEGIFTRAEIQEIFESMVEQDIFELMSIQSGQYEFETEERPAPLPDGELHADIGPILMEAARKADEVSEMRKALGPEDGVLVLTPAGRSPESALEDERTLLDLVNGVRRVDVVIEECGLDRYTATRLLFECARKGWVTLLRTAGKRQAEKAVAGVFDLGRAVRWVAPVAALLVAALLLSNPRQPFRGNDPLLGEWLNRAAQLRAADRSQAIRLAVEVYRIKKGEYPESLDLLWEEGLVPESELRDGPRSLWEYAVTANGQEFTLNPAPRGSGIAVD